VILYLDTSALFRLYVPEAGREAVVRAAETWDVRCTHLIAYVEMHAAVAKAERLRRLPREDADAILTRFERDWAALLVIGADEALVRRAGGLARQHGLRGYDSVHLAAAERLAATMPTEQVLLAAFDEDLVAAAGRLGLRVLGPSDNK
jgi:predicted nucleic acid-binding protein